MKRTLPGLISKGLILWSLTMALAVFVVYRRGYFLELEHPENSFFPHPVTRFGDFFLAFDEWKRFGGFGGVGYGVSYFPAMYIPLEVIQRITMDPWQGVEISRWASLLWTVVVLLVFLKRLDVNSKAIVGILLLISYPYLLILHSANLESWVVPLMLSAASAAHKGKWTYFGIMVGAAAAMKGLPLMYTAVAIASQPLRVATRAFLVTVLSALSLTSVAVIALPGGVLNGGVGRILEVFRATRDSQAMYVDLMVNSAAGIHYGHSFLNSVHAIWGMTFLPSDKFAPGVFFVFAVLGFISLWSLRRMQASIATFFFVCGSTMCVAPGTSTDYKLMFLAPGIALIAMLGRSPTALETWLFCLAVLAMAPKPYLRVGSDPWGYAMTYATTSLLILIVLLPIFMYGIMTLRVGEPQKV